MAAVRLPRWSPFEGLFKLLHDWYSGTKPDVGQTTPPADPADRDDNKTPADIHTDVAVLMSTIPNTGSVTVRSRAATDKNTYLELSAYFMRQAIQCSEQLGES